MKTLTKKTMFNRVLAAILSLVIVLTMLPAGLVSVSAEEEPQTQEFATVTTFTGGTVIDNGTANVQILIEDATLSWIKGNDVRADGWWVGIKITAPAGYSADALYQKKWATAESFGVATKFASVLDGTQDGKDYAEFWISVDAESLQAAADAGTNRSMTYQFDWNADGVYEQTIVFSVVPGEGIVLLPKPVNYGSVSTITPSTIQNNGTASMTVLIEDVTLEFIEAAHLPQNGYWVGLRMTAPEGFSEAATYKSKGNPASEYGAAKSFAESRDGNNYIELWFLVTPESLDRCAAENRNLTMMYTFDWDADGEYEQELTFSVVPSDKIILMKGDNQEYPILRSSIISTANEGGSVSVNEDTTGQLVVKKGEQVDIRIQADEGYCISDITVNGMDVSFTPGSNYFEWHSKAGITDMVISVTFAKLYTVTIQQGENGIVTTNPENTGGSVTVIDGTNVTVLATPNTGYHVSSVKINGVDQVVSGENDSAYETMLAVDADCVVEIIFTINVYAVTAMPTQNGEVVVLSPSVEYNGETEVKIVPADGYTIDTITVGGVTVAAVEKRADGIYIKISNVVENTEVSVTFKEKTVAVLEDVILDAENVALRKTENLFIVAPGKSVTFATTKAGIRLYDDYGLLGGGEDVQSVAILAENTITAVQLYYQAEGELYPDWHNVEWTVVSVYEDTTAPELSVGATKEPTNGYYNSDVTLDVTVEDKDVYSGLASVEYWITLDGVDGETTTMENFVIGATNYQGQIVVDSAIYNSDSVSVTVQVTDLAGHTETTTIDLKINSTVPTVTLTLNGDQKANALAGYYFTDRTLTITVVDREGTFSAANVAAGLVMTKDGQRVTLNENDITWAHSEDGYTHTGTYVFALQGAYTWDLTYTNVAGTQAEIDDAGLEKNFTLDSMTPVDLKITYHTPFVEKVLQAITFGFYKAPVTVTVEATDVTAGIENLTYSYTVQEGASDVNVGKTDVFVGEADLTFDGNKASYTFEIPAQFRGTVSFVAVDKAGNTAEYEDGRIMVIDTTIPGVKVTYEGPAAQNDKYYNGERTLTIEITEANFFVEDMDEEFLVISVGKILNDGTDASYVAKPTFTKNGDVYTAQITFEAGADYTFDITYTDRSGNVYDAYIKDEFTVDTTAPVVEVTYDNNTFVNDNQFKEKRTATIKVTEHNFRAEDVVVNITANGEVVGDYATYLTNPDNWTQDGDVYTATIEFADDAHYVFDLTVVDLAGNTASADTMKFTVDTVAPDPLTITYSQSRLQSLLQNITFGFYQAPVKVTIEATDATAGIESLTYSYTVQDGASDVNLGKTDVLVGEADLTFDGSKASYTFEIPAQFRGRVSFTAKDKAGNVATLTDENMLIVVDDIAPGVTVTYEGPAAQNGKYYNGERTLTIEITEANFFEEDMDEEFLVISVGKILDDGTDASYVAKPTFTKNGDVYTATIEFTDDADYTFDITYTDRSGNVYDEHVEDVFTVDKIAPVVEVTYNEQEARNENQYKANRTATIKVTEHNFRAKDVAVNITANGEEAIDYATYLTNPDNWTQDGDVYTATIEFADDAHYVFNISYTDLAGNAANAVETMTFTVDKTAPEAMTITYRTPLLHCILQTITFGFYNAPLEVTIEAVDATSGIESLSYSYTYTVVDENKVATDVTVEKTIEDLKFDGNKASYTYEIPEQYRGTISFTAMDKAGNIAEKVDTDENGKDKTVVIDTIAPGVTVSYDNDKSYTDKEGNIYFKAQRVATIVIDEANFFGANDLKDEFLVITVGKKANLDDDYLFTTVSPTFYYDSINGVYIATVRFDEDTHYAFDIKYTDRSGNVYDDYVMDEFTVDQTAPQLSLSYNAGSALNGMYYQASREATITVVEHNFYAPDMVFSLVATDITGTAVDLSLRGYDAYIRNQDNWTQEGDTWTISFRIDLQGNYELSADYTDLAGNESPILTGMTHSIEDAFCIDNSKPRDMKVTYSTSVMGSILNAITFGFYKEPVTVTLEATDVYAGIDYFKYSYAVQDGASGINVGKSNVMIENAKIKQDGNKFSASFEIPAQFRGNVSFMAVDKSGNVENFADVTVIVVDSIAPGITATYDKNDALNGNYFNTDRTLTIAIKEANFFPEDLADGRLVIKVEKTDNAGVTTVVNEMPTFEKQEGEEEDVYVAEIKFVDDADYAVEITYTDRSDNKSNSVKHSFTIDKTAPAIEVSYNNNDVKNEIYFAAGRKATITVTEHNFNAAEFVATIARDGQMLDATIAYLSTIANWTRKGDIYTIEVVFEDEGYYSFGVAYTDLAGNDNALVNFGDSKAPVAFCIDKTAPTDLSMVIDKLSILESLDTVVFNRFYNSTVKIDLNAADNIGLKTLQYQKVASVSEYEEGGVWTEYNSTTGMEVAPNEKFILFFRAEDMAGNATIVHSTGIVVDDKQPVGETTAPEIDITPVAANKYGFYNGNVSITINVIDPVYSGNGSYSGLNKIIYVVRAEDIGAETEEITLFEAGRSDNEGNSEIDPDMQLTKKWTGTITIDAEKFNSNNVIVTVIAIDNAGNERASWTSEGLIKIDTTAPTFTVAYDNNEDDASFKGYFDADRTATITVTERNFLPELFKLNITNTDGTIPVISNWETVKGTGNGDDTYHVAKVVFTADGDYTVEMAVTDEAGNANAVTVEPMEFTIDQTAPVIEVSYDNNDVKNGNYYNENRVATITITEHNFETGRINLILTATDNGETIKVPAISEWTSNGDTHTATITFAADARYVFDFEYTDMAGNAAADMAEHIFLLDKTNPVLKIEGIADQSANNDQDNIGFVITATDTNFDVFTPVLTAVIRNGNSFETKILEVGEMADITNGKTFTVTNVEADGIYQITCTLVDKAGNAYSEVILQKANGIAYTEEHSGEDTLLSFSVNREGSTFEVDKATLDMVNRYYVQNVTDDIVIVEVNVDPLNSHKISLNGNYLTEGTDYTVTAQGEGAQWRTYTYKINQSLFAEEGEYKLVIYSLDKAGNNAFSDIKQAAVEFVVDRTAPIVTVSGLATDGRYQTDKQTVTLIPTDDGGALYSLVVRLVDATGNVIKELLNLEGDELEDQLMLGGGMLRVEIEEGLYQNVQILCADRATGETEQANAYETTYRNISVSSSVFMIFWANVPLRWGTIGGVAAVAIGLSLFFVLKKKRKNA